MILYRNISLFNFLRINSTLIHSLNILLYISIYLYVMNSWPQSRISALKDCCEELLQRNFSISLIYIYSYRPSVLFRHIIKPLQSFKCLVATHIFYYRMYCIQKARTLVTYSRWGLLVVPCIIKSYVCAMGAPRMD